MIWHESSLSSCSREAFSGRNKRTIGGGGKASSPLAGIPTSSQDTDSVLYFPVPFHFLNPPRL